MKSKQIDLLQVFSVGFIWMIMICCIFSCSSTPEVKKAEAPLPPSPAPVKIVPSAEANFFEWKVRPGDTLLNIYTKYYKDRFGNEYKFNFDTYEIMKTIVAYNNSHVDEINQLPGNERSKARKIKIVDKKNRYISAVRKVPEYYNELLKDNENIRLPFFSIDLLENMIGENKKPAVKKIIP